MTDFGSTRHAGESIHVGIGVQRRVGQNIRTVARYRGVSLKNVAEACGWSQQALYERLRGGVKLSVDELQLIADVLGVTPEGLFARDLVIRDSGWS
jgi:transcriptional regulator with XRE-family HTH domain